MLQTQIAQTSLVAPFDGIVTQRLLDPGAYASPNAPIVQLAQIDSVYVNVNVADTSLPYVHKGTPISFTTTSVPGQTFTGSVFDVNAVPTTGTLSYRARIVMPNPRGLLRGGMLVAVRVRTQYHPDAIVIPRSAVVVNPSGATVFVVVDVPAPAGGAPGAAGPPGPAAPGRPAVHIAQAKMVPVRLGLQTDVAAEVESPEIRGGTTVITTRPVALQDKGMVALQRAAPPGGGAARPQSADFGAQ